MFLNGQVGFVTDVTGEKMKSGLLVLVLALCVGSAHSIVETRATVSDTTETAHSERRELFDAKDVAGTFTGGFVDGWGKLQSGVGTSFFKGIFEDLREYIVSIGNVLFVVGIAICYLYLPPKLMLVLGAVGIFFGSFIMQALMIIISGGLYLAAYVPGVMILIFWLIGFATSQAGQTLGRRLGLDENNDGKVNFRDLVIFVLKKYLPETAAEYEEHVTVVPTLYTLSKRLDRIERMLATIAKLPDEPPTGSASSDPKMMV